MMQFQPTMIVAIIYAVLVLVCVVIYMLDDDKLEATAALRGAAAPLDSRDASNPNAFSGGAAALGDGP